MFSLWSKRILQILVIIVVVTAVTVIWQAIDQSVEKATGTVSVPLGQLETARLYHGWIGENPNFTVYKKDDFMARPYEAVFVKGSGNTLILTGIAKDNQIYQLTIPVGKSSDQKVSTFDFVQGEGNTNITVCLVPELDPKAKHVGLVMAGFVIVVISLMIISVL